MDRRGPESRGTTEGAVENPPRPIFISTYPPAQCGLATFTQDLARAYDGATAPGTARIMAIRKGGEYHFYGPEVIHTINNAEPRSYAQAAVFAGEDDCDLVCIQHEYGLYPGDWGEAILDFCRHCTKPIFTTLHTLSLEPETRMRDIAVELAARSDRIVVMAELGVKILQEVYGVSTRNVVVIPHGAPDVDFQHRSVLKRKLGVQGRSVLLTFGLINPGKGIEHAIDAMPEIVRRHPGVLYLVVGRTHPEVKRVSGESYRRALMERAVELGVRDQVSFVDHYVPLEQLLLYLQVASVYVTPYTGRNQITSGTLAYAVAAGKAIVSTPYLNAEEALGDGRGILVDFGDSRGLAAAVCKVLGNRYFREELEIRTYEYGRNTIWSSVGAQYRRMFETALAERDA